MTQLSLIEHPKSLTFDKVSSIESLLRSYRYLSDRNDETDLLSLLILAFAFMEVVGEGDLSHGYKKIMRDDDPLRQLDEHSDWDRVGFITAIRNWAIHGQNLTNSQSTRRESKEKRQNIPPKLIEVEIITDEQWIAQLIERLPAKRLDRDNHLVDGVSEMEYVLRVSPLNFWLKITNWYSKNYKYICASCNSP